MKITRQVKKFKDEEYKEFQVKLLPQIKADTIIGVKPSDLRIITGALKGTPMEEDFMTEIPHEYFEENLIHAMLISEESDFAKCMTKLEYFLPTIENWAVCDQIDPPVFRKHKAELVPYLYKWLDSENEYIARFSVNMFTEHFLGEDFKPEYLEKLAAFRTDKYYVNMALADFFATAAMRQWDDAFLYFELGKLDPWINNRAIQLAKEKHRVSDEQYEALLKFKE